MLFIFYCKQPVPGTCLPTWVIKPSTVYRHWWLQPFTSKAAVPMATRSQAGSMSHLPAILGRGSHVWMRLGLAAEVCHGDKNSLTKIIKPEKIFSPVLLSHMGKIKGFKLSYLLGAITFRKKKLRAIQLKALRAPNSQVLNYHKCICS